MGGRRRKSRASRKMRGGMGYGVGNAITPGALEYVPSNTSVPMKADGSVDAKFAAAVGGRRRKTKKGGKKSKKSKKGGRKTRKMRGGAAGVYNSASTGYGYTGPTGGIRGGIAPAAGYQARLGGPTAGADGVMRV